MEGMRLSAFDFWGVLAVGVFSSVMIADLPNLRWAGREVDVRLTRDEALAGFREGVSWYGLYSGDDKIGFARLERRREAGGFAMRHRALLNLEILGLEQRIDTEFEATMNRKLELSHFSLSISGGLFEVEAVGTIGDGLLRVDLEAAGLRHRTTLEIEDPPTLDLGAAMIVLQTDLEVGSRYEIPVFDPLALAPRVMTLEFLGREDLAVVDGTVHAYHLRRRLADTAYDVWVNGIGETLREELPFGVVAVRETEAEATWGFDREGVGGAHLRLEPALLAEATRGLSPAGEVE